MTATTLATLSTDRGLVFDVIVAIEGYPQLITTGDTDQAVNAWDDTGYSSAIAGLAVEWAGRQELDPWSPFLPGASLGFTVQNCDGTDRFGIDTHRKEGGTSSRLTADVTPTDTTIAVLDGTQFADGQIVYIGCESIAVGTVVGNNLTGCTRGLNCPFTTDGSTNFARAHRAVPTVAGTNQLMAVARSIPTDWVGRWVGVYIHCNRGGVIDSQPHALLAWAGRIVGIRDGADGLTHVSCDPLTKVIADATIFREQYTARIAAGIAITAGTLIQLNDARADGTGGTDTLTASPFVCVASGASGATQINAGTYTLTDLQSKINAWLAGEVAATRLNFRWTYTAASAFPGGSRGRIAYQDPTITAGLNRAGYWYFADQYLGHCLGWDSILLAVTAGAGITATVESPRAPYRVVGPAPGLPGIMVTQTLGVEQESGSFVEQTAFLSAALTAGGFGTGIVKIGNAFFAATAPSSATIAVRRIDAISLLGVDNADVATGITVDETGEMLITQVLILTSTFTSLVMALLTSDGTSFNGAYDLLDEQCGVPVPYSLLGTGDELATELAATAGGIEPSAIIIEKPTKLVELLNVDFILRLVSLIWRRGRLTMASWATPTSSATLTIDATNIAAPSTSRDNLRPVTETADTWMRNVINIKCNRAPFSDTYRNPVNLLDTVSAASNGAKQVTLEARNAVWSSGVAGEDIFQILAHFIAGLPFLTRPATAVRVNLNHTCIETHTPGQVVLFTDLFARSPTTGIRGVSAKPALILSSDPHWDAGTVEVDLLLFSTRTLATYCDTAQVDDTAANAGYNAGTSTLTCYAHEHSESSAAADATLWQNGDTLTIREIDPTDETAPLSWDRIVASQTGNTITLTVALSSPAWDAAKKYRIIPRHYSAETARQAQCFQADDADDLVENAREAYGYVHFGVGQTTSYTPSVATEIPERHSEAMYGDGKPVDTGTARAMARASTNLIQYKTAPQCPDMYSETIGFGAGPGGSTWRLVRVRHIYVGPGYSSYAHDHSPMTRKLYVAPLFRSTDGSPASVRVSLVASLPSDASSYDITVPTPSTSATFTSSSAANVAPSAQALNTGHLQLGGGVGAGVGILLIEVSEKAVLVGIIECRIGPLEAP